MPELINSDSFLCLDGFDVSGTAAKLPFKWSQEIKEWICFKAPTLGSSDPLTKKKAPGAESGELPLDGYLDFGTNWQEARDALGSSNVQLLFGTSRTPGAPAFFFPAVQADAAVGGTVGDVIPFAANYQSNGVIVPGTLFEYRSITATGNGTNQTLGAVGSTQNLYLRLHSVAIPGGTTPTLTVVFERSLIGDYSDAVTVQTFSGITTSRAKESFTIAGPITDTHYRFRWTVGGSGGTYLIRLAAGIR